MLTTARFFMRSAMTLGYVASRTPAHSWWDASQLQPPCWPTLGISCKLPRRRRVLARIGSVQVVSPSPRSGTLDDGDNLSHIPGTYRRIPLNQLRRSPAIRSLEAHAAHTFSHSIR